MLRKDISRKVEDVVDEIVGLRLPHPRANATPVTPSTALIITKTTDSRAVAGKRAVSPKVKSLCGRLLIRLIHTPWPFLQPSNNHDLLSELKEFCYLRTVNLTAAM